MSTNSEMVTNTLWEEMKELAIEQQQRFYELLSDCMTYNSDEHRYLKQNIGYAIYGSPQSQEDASTSTDSGSYYSTETQNENADVTDIIGYNEKANDVIKAIYDQICRYTTEIDSTQPIYFGIIYNVIFCPEMYMQEKKKEGKNEEAEKKTEPEGNEGGETVEQVPMVYPIPVFKFWKINRNEEDTTKKKDEMDLIRTEIDHEPWYIDMNARVYKSWTDYTTNNNLPKCTMVLPKDGCYQADPNYPITEDYSTVWLEIIDSPACAWTVEACRVMDITSGVLGFGMVGLGIASMFTPIGPIVAVTGLAATGVTGTWQMGRCIQQLVDRNSHEESIHPLNRDAFPQWLGVTGSALGLGTIGGTMAISAAVTRGMTVNSAARVAYNSIQGGNLLVNGVGIIYQGYCMIDTFRNEGTLNYIDILNLSAHIMFFAGSVVQIQLAGDIIENTQGRVIDEYRDTLHNRRLRRQYNRFRRRAAANNTCRMSENAEVIRYIRNRNDLLSSVAPPNTSNRTPLNSQNTRTWSFENGQLSIKGIILLDPMKYVIHLLKSGILVGSLQNNPSSSQRYTNDSNFGLLTEMLSNLLTNLYTSSDCPRSQHLPTMPDFEPLLRQMSSMNINENFLCMLFTVTVKLMQRSENMSDFLLEVFCFIWCYCRENLRQWGINSRYRMQSNSASNILQNIIIAVSEAIDMMLENLYLAFRRYMTAN